MKVGETHEIVTNSRKLANPKFFWDIHDNECPRKFWEIHDNEYPRKLKITHVLRICHLPKKYTKIVRFYELRKNERKSWDFANFRKMGENHEILSTSWKWAKIMRYSQLPKNGQKSWDFSNFLKMVEKFEILGTSWKWAKIMKFF